MEKHIIVTESIYLSDLDDVGKTLLQSHTKCLSIAEADAYFKLLKAECLDLFEGKSFLQFLLNDSKTFAKEFLVTKGIEVQNYLKRIDNSCMNPYFRYQFIREISISIEGEEE